MGSAGDSPASVGDPPTGTAEHTVGKRAPPLIWIVVLVPSGESPDGTGRWPVLPTLERPDEMGDAIVRISSIVGCWN